MDAATAERLAYSISISPIAGHTQTCKLSAWWFCVAFVGGGEENACDLAFRVVVSFVLHIEFYLPFWILERGGLLSILPIYLGRGQEPGGWRIEVEIDFIFQDS